VTAVLLRADAGQAIGAGHLMRCLSLARALPATVEPIVVTSCPVPSLLDRVRDAGIRLERLEASHPDPTDVPAVAALARRTSASAIVIDGYHFDERYVDAMNGAGLRTIVIDDAPRLSEYRSAVLVDQNIGALSQPYRVASHTRVLLGPRFTLLAPEYAEVPARVVPACARRLLVTMGAADPRDATSLVLRALRPVGDRFDVTVVVGAANSRRELVRTLAGELPAASVVENASGLQSLLGAADMAIAAVGITIWEIARYGVPTLLLSGDPVHHRVAQIASRYGAHRWLGSIADVTDSAIATAVADLAEDASARREMARLGQALIDGRGAHRVATAVCNTTSTATTRPSSDDDAEPAWEMTASPESFGPFETRFRRIVRQPSARAVTLAHDEAVERVVWTDDQGHRTILVPPALQSRAIDMERYEYR